MAENTNVHEYKGIDHNAEFRWLDSQTCLIRIEPPVQDLSDSLLKTVVEDDRPGSTISQTMLALGGNGHKGGTLFRFSLELDDNVDDVESQKEIGTKAAQAIVALADAASSTEGLKALDF